MRAFNIAVVLLCSAVNYLAYAHPDLQSNVTDTTASTPCPFVEMFNDEGDDIESIAQSEEEATEQPPSPVLKGSSSNITVSMELRRNNAQKKKRGSTATNRGRRNGNRKKQSSSSTTNIYLPNAVTNTNTGRNRNVRVKCFTTDMYDEIDRDVMRIKNSITDIRRRGGFLGGLLRLVAHDAMDFDPSMPNRMGADGCFDPDHANNAGLDFVWSDFSPLKQLYERKYQHISKADFWVACANAVVRQSSIGQQLDMKNSFRWGRTDSDSCIGQGSRLPSTRGCSQTEDVFLRRMGLTWEEAVALMGAHTLGHGNRVNSGHQGTWSPSTIEATVFDKQYYEQIFRNSWRVSGQVGSRGQDWRTGNFADDRLMLNTDICLAYNIDNNLPCCTTGNSQCRQCPRYASNSPRKAAEAAVLKMLGGRPGNTNNVPFYESFEVAWNKMTAVGQSDLLPLSTEECWI